LKKWYPFLFLIVKAIVKISKVDDIFSMTNKIHVYSSI